MPRSLREYADAESRVRLSLALRGTGLPHHTYPDRVHDLDLMREFHAEHGVPPAGLFQRLWWSVKRGVVRR